MSRGRASVRRRHPKKKKRLKLEPWDGRAGGPLVSERLGRSAAPKNIENPQHCRSFAEACLARCLLNSAYPLRLWPL